MDNISRKIMEMEKLGKGIKISKSKKNKNKNNKEKEKLIKLTEKAIFYGEQIKKILPKTPFENQGEDRSYGYGYEKNEPRLAISMQERISKLNDKLNDMDEKKEELILKIIGQLYEGILIPKVLTIRKGKFYEYKRQYQISLGEVKKKIINNKAIVSKRLDKPLLEILEFMLQKYKKSYNTTGDDERQKLIKINEINILKKEDSNTNNDEMYALNYCVAKVDTILIKADGEVQFCYQTKEDLYTQEFFSKIYGGLFLKFKKEIKQNAELFVQELETDINSFQEQIKEIQDKGQNQLALIELEQNGEQNQQQN